MAATLQSGPLQTSSTGQAFPFSWRRLVQNRPSPAIRLFLVATHLSIQFQHRLHHARYNLRNPPRRMSPPHPAIHLLIPKIVPQQLEHRQRRQLHRNHPLSHRHPLRPSARRLRSRPGPRTRHLRRLSPTQDRAHLQQPVLPLSRDHQPPFRDIRPTHSLRQWDWRVVRHSAVWSVVHPPVANPRQS